METVYFLGVDIAKKTFDASLTIDAKGFDASQCENNAKSIDVFFRDLKKKFGLSYSQLIVCMEHTGIYCLPLLNFLVENKIKVCLESAVQIKRSQGLVRGKNDKVDALRIATYAYKNREHLAFWKPQRLLLKEQVRLAKSVVGVGDIIAMNMVVSTGEFERISEPKRFACYAGVAPFEHSSGSSVRGKTRVSKMANVSIKKLLTMGAKSAILYDPELKAYAERKMAEGKHYFNVVNAVRNKLITRVFACVKGNRTYEKIHVHAFA
jgi:transposase